MTPDTSAVRITPLTSLQNPKVKEVVHLMKRPNRDEQQLILIEGYREVKRALDNGIRPDSLFFCPPLFMGENERALIDRAAAAGAALFECTEPVFRKMAYRDRPEGLLAVAPQVRLALGDLRLGASPLIVVAEAIEKPGNLGSIIRSADAVAVDAVLVCDRCTDLWNPNVVRASIGTVFSLPVVEASTDEALAWLKERGIQVLAATPHAERSYAEADMTRPTAIVVGAEQYGLSSRWMNECDVKVRIPMLGQVDSLNVSNATTILLYEAARQRGFRPGASDQ